jgi:hypothetical protein
MDDENMSWPLRLVTRRYYSFHFFVSYQSSDLSASTSLTYSLQKFGLRVWLDKDTGIHTQDFRSPDDFRGKRLAEDPTDIRSSLEVVIGQSMIVIVLTSAQTLKSAWVRTEMRIARNLKIPIFFVHLSGPSDTRSEALHGPDQGLKGIDLFIGVKDQDRSCSRSAPSSAIELLNELCEMDDVNIIGRVIIDESGLNRASHQLNQIIEVSELVLHKRDAISAATIAKHWPDYESLCSAADHLNQLIYDRYGFRIVGRREPRTKVFSVKQPFAKRRVAYLQKVLEDESFRENVFCDPIIPE